jgi:hypothetical protein
MRYTGIVMSSHSTHSGGTGLCVDNVDFDASIAAPISSARASYYPTEVKKIHMDSSKI